MIQQKSRKWRSFISMLLAICLMLGIMPAAFAAEAADTGGKGTIKYVSLGASNVNGFGLSGYLPEGTTAANKDTANVYGYLRSPEGSYPDLIRDYLVEQGYAVELDQLAISSMRVEELRVLLDEDYYGDAYTEWRFTGGDKWFEKAEQGGLEALRSAYQNSIADADLITVDIGVNNFGVFIGNHILGSDKEFPMTNISPEIAQQYASAKVYVAQLLAEYGWSVEDLNVGLDLEHAVDILAYALAGFCVNFDIVMGEIYALNPDATVVVVSIQNLMEGLEITVPGVEQALPFGDMCGALVNAANIYIAGGSAYAQKYLCADVRQNGHVEFFADQLLAWNGTDALDSDIIDCFNLYDGSLYLNYTVPASIPNWSSLSSNQQNAALNAAYSAVAHIMQAGLQVQTLDITGFAQYGSRLTNALGNKISAEITKAVTAALTPGQSYVFDEDAFFTLDGVPRVTVETVAALAARTSIGNSFFAHPNRNGHREIQAAILNTLENGTAGKDILMDELAIAAQDLMALAVKYGPEALLMLEQYVIEEGWLSAEDVVLLKSKVNAAVAAVEQGDEAAIRQLCSELIEFLYLKSIEYDEEIQSVLNWIVDTYLAQAVEILKELAVKYGPEALQMFEQYVISEGWLSAGDLQQLKLKTNEIIGVLERADEDTVRQLCADLIRFVYDKSVEAGVINDKEVQKVIGWMIDVYDYFTANDPEQIKADALALLKKLWDEKIGQHIRPDDELIEDLIDDLDGLLELVTPEQMKAYITHMLTELWNTHVAPYVAPADAYIQQFIADLNILLDILENTSAEDVQSVVRTYIDALKSKYAQLIYDATHTEYTADEKSYYVALGGYTASGSGLIYGENPYFALLAEELNMKSSQIAALGERNGLLSTDILAYVQANAASIAKADLITYEGDASSILFAVLNQEKPDWSRYFSDEDLALMEEIRAELLAILAADWSAYADVDVTALTAELKARVLLALPAELRDDAQNTAAVENRVNEILNICLTQIGTALQIAENEKNDVMSQVNALDPTVLEMAEKFVYACVAYSIDTIKALEAIQTINPDATVLVVGMYNPLRGLQITVNGTTIDVGEMMELVIDATNVYYTAYAICDGNVTFVDVSNAETAGFSGLNSDNLNSSDMISVLASLVVNAKDNMHANAAGHAYIFEQIMEALAVKTEGLLGDVNLDGTVDADDLTILARHIAKIEPMVKTAALANADVTGDGMIDANDLVLLSRYVAKIIPSLR
ncbi:MAG: hypothetical protein IJF49_00905 [Clostridia bacterium]|nr:hypothetical protein [Clostridia bacterium]